MSPYVLLAKRAVENYIRKKEIPSSSEKLPKEFFSRKAGVFVTIKKQGCLRGCIGTYLPTKENIAQEIIYNAIAAATEDYRFDSIKKEELPYLSYVVYILSKPEAVKDIKELNPKKYGIIVKTSPISHPGNEVMLDGHAVPKSALLLPDLEGIDTIDKQISAACQKAGIDARFEKIIIYKFTAEKYEE